MCFQVSLAFREGEQDLAHTVADVLFQEQAYENHRQGDAYQGQEEGQFGALISQEPFPGIVLHKMGEVFQQDGCQSGKNTDHESQDQHQVALPDVVYQLYQQPLYANGFFHVRMCGANVTEKDQKDRVKGNAFSGFFGSVYLPGEGFYPFNGFQCMLDSLMVFDLILLHRSISFHVECSFI